MMHRLKAAWKVLRGEWVARPRPPFYQFPSVWINGEDQHGNVDTGGNAFVTMYRGRR